MTHRLDVAAAALCAMAAMCAIAAGSRPLQLFGTFMILMAGCVVARARQPASATLSLAILLGPPGLAWCLQGDTYGVAMACALVAASFGLCAWARNIRERNSEHSSVESQNRELACRLLQFEKEMAAAHRSKAELLAAVSRDLRQPVQALELAAELLDPKQPVGALRTRLASLGSCVSSLSAMLMHLQQGWRSGPGHAVGKAGEGGTATAGCVQLTGKCIAVLEDDGVVLEGMLDMLRSWGCRAVGAADMRGLMAALGGRLQVPDLLLVDVQLCGRRSGLSAISRLRHWVGSPIPVILVTGDLDPALERVAQAQNARLAHKPLRPQRLRELIVESLQSVCLVPPTD